MNATQRMLIRQGLTNNHDKNWFKGINKSYINNINDDETILELEPELHHVYVNLLAYDNESSFIPIRVRQHNTKEMTSVIIWENHYELIFKHISDEIKDGDYNTTTGELTKYCLFGITRGKSFKFADELN